MLFLGFPWKFRYVQCYQHSSSALLLVVVAVAVVPDSELLWGFGLLQFFSLSDCVCVTGGESFWGLKFFARVVGFVCS